MMRREETLYSRRWREAPRSLRAAKQFCTIKDDAKRRERMYTTKDGAKRRTNMYSVKHGAKRRAKNVNYQKMQFPLAPFGDKLVLLMDGYDTAFLGCQRDLRETLRRFGKPFVCFAIL